MNFLQYFTCDEFPPNSSALGWSLLASSQAGADSLNQDVQIWYVYYDYTN